MCYLAVARFARWVEWYSPIPVDHSRGRAIVSCVVQVPSVFVGAGLAIWPYFAVAVFCWVPPACDLLVPPVQRPDSQHFGGCGRPVLSEGSNCEWYIGCVHPIYGTPAAKAFGAEFWNQWLKDVFTLGNNTVSI